MADNVAITAGTGTAIRTDDVGGVQYQVVKLDLGGDGVSSPLSSSAPLPIYNAGRAVTYKGSSAVSRMPGRAGTGGQKLLSLFNAAGSTVVVRVERVAVDLSTTVVKAVTVPPPVIRLYRVTTAPTNGGSANKVPRDSSLTSSASVTLLSDAASEGVSAGTALTATLTNGGLIQTWAHEFAPRLITGAGYEMSDRVEFVFPDEIVLRAGEGIVVMLDYTAASQNPTTDFWLAAIHWSEATS